MAIRACLAHAKGKLATQWEILYDVVGRLAGDRVSPELTCFPSLSLFSVLVPSLKAHHFLVMIWPEGFRAILD
jgi:hypothetical protein